MTIPRHPSHLGVAALVTAVLASSLALAGTGAADRYTGVLPENGYGNAGYILAPEGPGTCSGLAEVTLHYLGGEYGEAPEGVPDQADGDRYYLCLGTGDDAGLWMEDNGIGDLQTEQVGSVPPDAKCDAEPLVCAPGAVEQATGVGATALVLP